MIDKNSTWDELLSAYTSDVERHRNIPVSDYPIEQRIVLVDRYAGLAHGVIYLILEKLADTQRSSSDEPAK